MGVTMLICQALAGPVLLYLILLAHVVYQIFLKQPKTVNVPSWPVAVKTKEKDAIIAARKPILREFMEFLDGKNVGFFKKHTTENVSWISPIESFTGFDEVSGFGRLLTGWVKSANIIVNKEHHAPNKIVMDWNVKVQFEHTNSCFLSTASCW